MVLRRSKRIWFSNGCFRPILLNTIAAYDYPVDYIKKQEEIVMGMTIEEHKALAQKYIQPDKMIFLVVGDAKTQFAQLEQLGFGKPVLIENK